ncbi:hypothetical protein DDB_G0271972 [Dictyostelium discoideum AX4]|uniref:Uncharacterized protein n=1 Tax=Dictyostelium discoideum TaxID=44689 RepID=Q86JP9_DICDI|nr:hypothetical protein DDB_G0271972 [Dictyostelium discoideum AX4]EAL71420.1 hypothetical protein DDB_G0271972 [Dictyostelium discoideum AX4]|eukprot:XP_645348.1 hypothetical protein DDB_G0271972 [Dictyostelium discoideum AX4]
MNKIILIAILLSIAISGAFCSLTQCRQDCQDTYDYCVTNYNTPLPPIETCALTLGTCLVNCIYPYQTGTPSP